MLRLLGPACQRRLRKDGEGPTEPQQRQQEQRRMFDLSKLFVAAQSSRTSAVQVIITLGPSDGSTLRLPVMSESVATCEAQLQLFLPEDSSGPVNLEVSVGRSGSRNAYICGPRRSRSDSCSSADGGRSSSGSSEDEEDRRSEWEEARLLTPDRWRALNGEWLGGWAANCQSGSVMPPQACSGAASCSQSHRNPPPLLTGHAAASPACLPTAAAEGDAVLLGCSSLTGVLEGNDYAAGCCAFHVTQLYRLERWARHQLQAEEEERRQRRRQLREEEEEERQKQQQAEAEEERQREEAEQQQQQQQEEAEEERQRQRQRLQREEAKQQQQLQLQAAAEAGLLRQQANAAEEQLKRLLEDHQRQLAQNAELQRQLQQYEKRKGAPEAEQPPAKRAKTEDAGAQGNAAELALPAGTTQQNTQQPQQQSQQPPQHTAAACGGSSGDLRWSRSRQLCRHQRRRPLPCRACWPAWGVYGRMLWRGSGAQHCRGPQLGLAGAAAAAAAAAAGQILKSQIQMQATAGGTPARPQARPKQHLARRRRQLRQAGRSWGAAVGGRENLAATCMHTRWGRGRRLWMRGRHRSCSCSRWLM